MPNQEHQAHAAVVKLIKLHYDLCAAYNDDWQAGNPPPAVDNVHAEIATWLDENLGLLERIRDDFERRIHAPSNAATTR